MQGEMPIKESDAADDDREAAQKTAEHCHAAKARGGLFIDSSFTGVVDCINLEREPFNGRNERHGGNARNRCHDGILQPGHARSSLD